MTQKLATAAPGEGNSRRRMAIAERGRAVAERLTGRDVVALQEDPSAANRALIARKFGESYDELVESSPRDLVAALLGLMVGDVEAQVRRALAVAVADSDKLPARIVGQLARDRIEVARPILEQSPLLQDPELIEIVRTNAMQYALAVAGRERISESLADALVDSGQQPVVVRLVGNAGAQLSAKALGRVMADWAEDAEVQDRLVRRPALPFELVEQLVGAIGDRIEWELVQTRKMPPEQARALMQAVRERTSIGLTAKEHGDRKLERHLRERLEAGALDHDAVLGLLRDGDVAAFELALGMHAKLEPARVRRLAYNDDRRHLAALCIRAGVPAPHYVTIRMALDLAGRSVQPNQAKDDSYSSEAMQYLLHQYERLRLDEAAIEELIEEV
ncbi:MAG: DUF2336 domain-containing protein [Geminicoccaceae bacterium]|jgi:uncharacterized protein (DUF2336 family)|nr:DUF2336 domain-containing protein [Geminicoccaceae bacterium]MCB9967451.1 DUF2336 domain-containing protein [Geminicoccaceae bacterium]HRY25312.1 DUF2336 domain-containing protein [Geminicoccaceae bacterium]